MSRNDELKMRNIYATQRTEAMEKFVLFLRIYIIQPTASGTRSIMSSSRMLGNVVILVRPNGL
jgi:hypothetical protein